MSSRRPTPARSSRTHRGTGRPSNAIEFEKAYASALKSDAPRDRKTFSDWDYKFRSDWKKKAGRKVPFVMDLSLVTRRFGRFGTFGCFLLAGDVELFQELHGKKRNRDGKVIYDRVGKEVPVKYYREDAYLGVVRWKYFRLEEEERDIEARKDKDDEKEGTMLENLGGFVDDSTLRYFRKNGNGDHAPRRVGKTMRDKRQSRRERRENGDE
ncbi:hypothetical protein HZB94_03065 [Candidatus Falkowbacteria bacterium]|nr:hypothetical protein [Candidatus Falkowbacteria bacterium]